MLVTANSSKKQNHSVNKITLFNIKWQNGKGIMIYVSFASLLSIIFNYYNVNELGIILYFFTKQTKQVYVLLLQIIKHMHIIRIICCKLTIIFITENQVLVHLTKPSPISTLLSLLFTY